MKILVTGFEPFGGDHENSSREAVLSLQQAWQGAAQLVTSILPVEFRRSREILVDLVERHSPDAVMCVGEADGRTSITPERWAGSLWNARIPDNAGYQPTQQRIDNGPARLPARIDPQSLARHIEMAGIAAEESETAGSFVCNAVFRAALTVFEGPVAFIHIPAIRMHGRASTGVETDIPHNGSPEQASKMTRQPQSIDDLTRALTAAVDYTVREYSAITFRDGSTIHPECAGSGPLTGHALAAAELVHLYDSVGWTAYTGDPADLATAVQNSLWNMTAWDDARLVGLIRVVGDDSSIAYVQDILVDPAYQRRGIGRNLFAAVCSRFDHCRQIVLLTDDSPETAAFYGSVGLAPVGDLGVVSYARLTRPARLSSHSLGTPPGPQ